jgi:hypothetical protein
MASSETRPLVKAWFERQGSRNRSPPSFDAAGGAVRSGLRQLLSDGASLTE